MSEGHVRSGMQAAAANWNEVVERCRGLSYPLVADVASPSVSLCYLAKGETVTVAAGTQEVLMCPAPSSLMTLWTAPRVRSEASSADEDDSALTARVFSCEPQGWSPLVTLAVHSTYLVGAVGVAVRPTSCPGNERCAAYGAVPEVDLRLGPACAE